jgi:hypothetical protein
VFVQLQDDQTPLGWAIGRLGEKEADSTLCSVCNKLQICPNLSKKGDSKKKITYKFFVAIFSQILICLITALFVT